MRLLYSMLVTTLCLSGCAEDKKQASSSDEKAHEVATAPAADCGSVRLTSYTASNGGWCEFNRNAPMLPAFAREGLTLAIAEPWNGSSYGGEKGEACGECWEIATIDATRIVMVHDLCPTEGNPVCSGSHFHFDVSTESAKALKLQGLDAASTRRVPCPVNGNAYLQIIDRNQWGYVRFQVVNHRYPVRKIEFRSKSEASYYPAERSGGAWAVSEHGEMFADSGEGGTFRLTSAAGEMVTMPNVLTTDVTKGQYFDLGAQFSEPPEAGGQACKFKAPADVYVDGYGGIERVNWMMNPWAKAKPTEVTEGCVSGSCLRIEGMGPGSGFHIYYRQAFAPTSYKTLSFSSRTNPGKGTFQVKLTGDNATCSASTVNGSDTWATTKIPLADVCQANAPINAVTFYGDSSLTLMLDDLRFEP